VGGEKDSSNAGDENTFGSKSGCFDSAFISILIGFLVDMGAKGPWAAFTGFKRVSRDVCGGGTGCGDGNGIVDGLMGLEVEVGPNSRMYILFKDWGGGGGVGGGGAGWSGEELTSEDWLGEMFSIFFSSFVRLLLRDFFFRLLDDDFLNDVVAAASALVCEGTSGAFISWVSSKSLSARFCDCVLASMGVERLFSWAGIGAVWSDFEVDFFDDLLLDFSDFFFVDDDEDLATVDVDESLPRLLRLLLLLLDDFLCFFLDIFFWIIY